MSPVVTLTHGLTNCEDRGIRARKALKDTDDCDERGRMDKNDSKNTVDRLERRSFVLSAIWTII